MMRECHFTTEETDLMVDDDDLYAKPSPIQPCLIPSEETTTGRDPTSSCAYDHVP